MTQNNINTMSAIVDYLEDGKKLSQALNYVYAKRHVIIPFNEDDMQLPLQTLGLSNRTQNALLRYGARTIGDTVRVSTNKELDRVRNFGHACGIELFETLLDYCWDRMDDEHRAAFLIDAVERNVCNLREA